MGLLDGKTHKEYYTGNDLGNYQFTSLVDIINQFMVAYVGENKIIPKISRIDVAFHAQRALQELSFDTFKSIKSQQIDLPPTLVMPLPHDYVNYTKLSQVDSSGIKHVLYPVRETSNPFQVAQVSNGNYNFDYTTSDIGILEGGDSSSSLTDIWEVITHSNGINNILAKFSTGGIILEHTGSTSKIKTSFNTRNGSAAHNNGAVHTAYQALDVSDIDYLDISALGSADTKVLSYPATAAVSDASPNVGTLRFGLSTQIPENNYINNSNGVSNTITAATYTSNNVNPSIFDLTTIDGDASYIEWVGPATAGTNTSTEELLRIDVSNETTVYAVVVSYVTFAVAATATPLYGLQAPTEFNSLQVAHPSTPLFVSRAEASNFLIPEFGNEKNSSTWNSYKSLTPSENNNDDYEDDVYWPNHGERYGLDPQHAQINGSFYIDPRLGRIHFSSNISGKTVILDYISDSLGTDKEMQVHKFAEEAMYKYISHAILSTSSYGQQLVPRLTKEKFAAIRKAKLRLSNIKLEELTQILRGKSKQIKH